MQCTNLRHIGPYIMWATVVKYRITEVDCYTACSEVRGFNLFKTPVRIGREFACTVAKLTEKLSEEANRVAWPLPRAWYHSDAIRPHSSIGGTDCTQITCIANCGQTAAALCYYIWQPIPTNQRPIQRYHRRPPMDTCPPKWGGVSTHKICMADYRQ